MTNVVAVENEAAFSHFVQFVIDQIRDRALAARAQSGEPQNTTLIAVEFLFFRTGNGMLVPKDFDFRRIHLFSFVS